MASVSKRDGFTVVRWDRDDWERGIMAEGRNAQLDDRMGNGMSFATAATPHRFPGYISPGFNAADAINVAQVAAVLKDGVSNGAKSYAIEGGTKLHEITSSNGQITNAGSFPHTITAHGGHSAVVGSSVALYYVGTTKYLFYSWNDNTDGDVGRFDLSSTFDDDFMSTTPASGAVLTTTNPHPMIVGADDILYIADGRDIAGFDGQTGANGTFAASQGLRLPVGFIITSFAKLPEFLVIFAYKSSASGSSFLRSESAAFIWDYASNDATRIVPLNANYVNGGFSWRGTVGCFGEGQSVESKNSKLMIYDGRGFQTVVTFEEGIPGHGGVEAFDDVVEWNADGDIFRYGAPYPGFKVSYNRITALGGTTSEGMLRNFFNTALLGSAGTGTSGGLNVLSSNYAANASVYTGLVNLVFGYRKRGKIETVKVVYKDTVDSSTGRGFDLFITTDQNASNSNTRGVTTQLEVNSTRGISTHMKHYDQDISGNELPEITNNVGMLMQWGSESPADASDAPVVESIEVYIREVAAES